VAKNGTFTQIHSHAVEWDVLVSECVGVSALNEYAIFALEGNAEIFGAVLVWNISNGAAERTFGDFQAGEDHLLATAMLAEDRIALAYGRSPPGLWDIKSGKILCRLGTEPAREFIVEPEGGRMLVVFENGDVKAKDTRNGSDIEMFKPSGLAISGLNRDRLGGMPLLSTPGLVRQRASRRASFKESFLTAVTHSNPNEELDESTRGDESTAYVCELLDLSNGKPITRFVGHELAINDIQISNDMSLAVSVSSDQTLKLWNVANGIVLGEYGAECGMISCAISANNQVIWAGDQLGQLHRLRIE
jgi:WD40 repeat protein